ncbi:hypothetical protein [Sporosarcina sp. FSL K6-5500]|uniref:hypothetical protein n=1 Tax=Sporosarcina sp. FSL K6-5500 TaxID=2921558 RepID=UPI0030F7990B
MTIDINEIADLVQHLQVRVEEDERNVISVDIYQRNSRVMMTPESFLAEFIDFEIKTQNSIEYSYQISKLIGGVKFFAIMSTAEIVDLKTAMPNQWEYIQKEIQSEAA